MLDHHEGPQTPRWHVFSIHEAARLLVEVGKGTSYRWSSRTTRRDANRLSRTLFGRLTPSQHGQLAQDYLATFAPVVLDAFGPPERWPDAIVLDSKPIPFTLTTRHANGTITSQQATYHLLGIHGYPAGRGSGRPWRISVAGGADGVEWEKVLRSLPGTPSWVVCDDDKGIKSVVRTVWPNAVIHTCEGHLRRLLLDRLAADGQSPSSSFAARAGAALADPGRWATFVAEANATGLAHTSHWLAGKDRLMRRQFAARQPDLRCPPWVCRDAGRPGSGSFWNARGRWRSQMATARLRRTGIKRMTDRRREPFFVGGWDAGIEEMLLDAGGAYLESGRSVERPYAGPPAIELRWDPENRVAMESAAAVLGTGAYSASEPGGIAVGQIPEPAAAGLLRRLAAAGGLPDRIIARSVELLPAQARALREAVGPDGPPVELV